MLNSMTKNNNKKIYEILYVLPYMGKIESDDIYKEYIYADVDSMEKGIRLLGSMGLAELILEDLKKPIKKIFIFNLTPMTEEEMDNEIKYSGPKLIRDYTRKEN